MGFAHRRKNRKPRPPLRRGWFVRSEGVSACSFGSDFVTRHEGGGNRDGKVLKSIRAWAAFMELITSGAIRDRRPPPPKRGLPASADRR